MSEKFNEKWKNNLNETHNLAVCEGDKVKQQIENIINDIDPVEVLSHISMLTNFVPEGEPEFNQDWRKKPILHFLVGLCLKNGNPGNRQPDYQEIGIIMDLLDKYLNYYSLNLISNGAKQEQVSKVDGLVLSARLLKIISQNSSIYKFQLDDLSVNVFCKFDDYFVRNVGFTISDALDFGNKIIIRYEKLWNKRLDKVKEALETTKRDLKNPIKGHHLQETLRNNNTTEEEYMKSYFSSLMLTSTKEIFVFRADEFCKDEKIKEIDKFEKYLKVLSCKFGDGNLNFNSDLDENIIITKPIINIDIDKYFSPTPNDLIFNIPLIFERFLEDEKKNQTDIWEKYQKAKADYVEDKTYEYFSRLFPEQNIHRNLKYIYQGKEFEVDILLLYDNKIFVIEAKSGLLTEPAKRGAIKSLKSDLRKLIEEAYQQGRRTREYIKSTQNVIFKDKKTGKRLDIKFEPYQNEFFLINVTLEHLMSFATGLKKLKALDLFEENEYPWSVNLFELDIITNYLPSPTFFIHYLERRLAAQEENVFYSFDELSFLAWYLEKGNFYVPPTEEYKTSNIVLLNGSTIFDDHFLYGKKDPDLKIEPDLIKIIRILEELHSFRHSKIASALLDFSHETREFILKNINESIGKTKKDGKRHDFTAIYKSNVLYKSALNTYNDMLYIGFSFMAQNGREGLRERLRSYCAFKKYQTKAVRWIGIGRDVSDNELFVNEFIYLDFLWERLPEMDALFKGFPSKE